LVNQQRAIKKRRTAAPGFWALVAVGVIIVIVVLAILVDSAVYYNKVHAGVSVNGIALGGQTKTEAIASLDSVVDKAQSSPITLTSGDKKWTLMPADVGTTMDVEGAVKAAMEVSRKISVPAGSFTSARRTSRSRAASIARRCRRSPRG